MSGRRARKPSREKRVVASIVALLLAVLVAAFLFAYLNSPAIRSSSVPRAVILDQLSQEGFENKTFVETATNILQQAGYQVDYYSGEKATVDLYRSVVSQGYSLIIIRSHCGISADAKEIAFFTSQPYSQPNLLTQATLWSDVYNDRIGTATIYGASSGETSYFAIRPGFVKQYGSFDNATVIVMGCYGMNYTNTMAADFTAKGARVYIGWDGLENADHSDEATSLLLQHLLIENQTVEQAVQTTLDEVKVDPMYNSSLGFYPHDSGNQTLQDLGGRLVSETADEHATQNYVELIALDYSSRVSAQETVQKKAK